MGCARRPEAKVEAELEALPAVRFQEFVGHFWISRGLILAAEMTLVNEGKKPVRIERADAVVYHDTVLVPVAYRVRNLRFNDRMIPPGGKERLGAGTGAGDVSEALLARWKKIVSTHPSQKGRDGEIHDPKRITWTLILYLSDGTVLYGRMGPFGAPEEAM